MPVWQSVGAAGLFYALGSIPFSYIIGRLAGRLDIREHGSGNVGATNVGRVTGFYYGLLAFGLDAAKGMVAAWLAVLWGVPLWLAGLATVGHNWSLFLKFTGGKGVATTLGLLGVISWPALLVVTGCWALTALVTRYVSLASMISLLVAPLALYLFDRQAGAVDWECVLLFTALGLTAVWQHRANIRRLFRGEEGKIFKKQRSPS